MARKEKAILSLKGLIANRRRDMICLECQGDYKQFKEVKKTYSDLVFNLKKITKAKSTELAKADFLQDYTGPNVFEN